MARRASKRARASFASASRGYRSRGSVVSPRIRLPSSSRSCAIERSRRSRSIESARPRESIRRRRRRVSLSLSPSFYSGRPLISVSTPTTTNRQRPLFFSRPPLCGCRCVYVCARIPCRSIKLSCRSFVLAVSTGEGRHLGRRNSSE